VAFDAVTQAYGKPKSGTAATAPKGVEAIVEAGLAGIYAGGSLSLASVREEAGLGPWSRWLPKGAQLFGTTGFGTLFVIAGEDLYLVDTQYGQVIDSEPDLEYFLDAASAKETREELFHEPLFQTWVELNDGLKPTDVLSPTPALPLGGDWVLDQLQPAHLRVYLELLAQCFGPEAGAEIEYR
jgi:Domain of unknown function (DUF1851)